MFTAVTYNKDNKAGNLDVYIYICIYIYIYIYKSIYIYIYIYIINKHLYNKPISICQ